MITDEFNFEEHVREWSLKLYKQLGFEVIKLDKKDESADFILKYNNKLYRIEEKVRRKYYPDLCFEIMQDVKTCSLGWVYKCNADYIFYIYWDMNKDVCKYIYKIKWAKCKNYVMNNLINHKYKVGKSIGGWGYTIFLIIPWLLLEKNKIAERAYPFFAKKILPKPT